MRRSILRTALFALLVSCDSSGTIVAVPDAAAPPATRTAPNAVHVVGSALRDTQGRQLLFRGYNVKTSPIFDTVFDDGRVPTVTFPDLTEAQVARAEELGFNVFRLALNWSSFEPQPGQYSDAWMAKLDSVLAMAKAHAIYVFLDMHQDAYSKEIGLDGQPLWAIVPPPTELLEGPADGTRDLTGDVLNAESSFFANAPALDGRPLQSAYIAALQRIAAHVVGDPTVLGYEDINEPFVLRQSELVEFHEACAAGIHAIDADAPVLFEPITTRNETDSSIVTDVPWSSGPGVYAVHIYTGVFSMPGVWTEQNEDASILAPSMAAAEKERAAWGTPMFVTEFGNDRSQADGVVWLSDELDLQDEYLASSTVWQLAEYGTWGLYDGNGNERPATAKIVSRMYPRAVAGDLVKIERPAIGDMKVTYRPTTQTAGLPHEVSLSSAYVTNAAITCDGAPVSFTQATGRASFVCPVGDTSEHVFEVKGTAAP